MVGISKLYLRIGEPLFKLDYEDSDFDSDYFDESDSNEDLKALIELGVSSNNNYRHFSY